MLGDHRATANCYVYSILGFRTVRIYVSYDSILLYGDNYKKYIADLMQRVIDAQAFFKRDLGHSSS